MDGKLRDLFEALRKRQMWGRMFVEHLGRIQANRVALAGVFPLRSQKDEDLVVRIEGIAHEMAIAAKLLLSPQDLDLLTEFWNLSYSDGERIVNLADSKGLPEAWATSRILGEDYYPDSNRVRSGALVWSLLQMIQRAKGPDVNDLLRDLEQLGRSNYGVTIWCDGAGSMRHRRYSGEEEIRLYLASPRTG